MTSSGWFLAGDPELAPSADGGPAHGFLTLTPEPSSRVLEEIAGMESMAEVQLIKL